jgi:hypothetical protein
MWADLGSKPVLVGIAADARHTLNTEVEGLDREPSLLEERHDEAPEAAVDVQTNVLFLRKLAESDNVVLAPVREVHGGTDNLSAS